MAIVFWIVMIAWFAILIVDVVRSRTVTTEWLPWLAVLILGISSFGGVLAGL